MDRFEPYASLGLALAVGLLVGFEREQSAPAVQQGSFLGGARTYPLVALVGASASLLLPLAGPVPLVAGLLALAAFLLVSYAADVRAGLDRGLTSEVAFLLTYLLGALCTARGLIEPLARRATVLLAVAVVVTLILSAKPSIHALAHKATRDDVLAALKFLIVAVVVLPLLPRQPYGPWGGIRPFSVGLMVVFIAGVGFLGYLAVRLLGPGRGLGATGLLGGLASSTAVTLSLSGRARAEPALSQACALAVLAASAEMPVRMLALAAVVHGPLVAHLWGPLLAAAAAGGAVCLWLYRHGAGAAEASHGLPVSNPFELSAALKFGALYVGVLLLARLAQATLGQQGTYLAGLVAGLADVDAITVSLASLSREGALDPRVAARAIVLAAGSNTVVKAGLGLAVGGLAFGRRLLPGYGLMLLAGGGTLALLWASG